MRWGFCVFPSRLFVHTLLLGANPSGFRRLRVLFAGSSCARCTQARWRSNGLLLANCGIPQKSQRVCPNCNAPARTAAFSSELRISFRTADFFPHCEVLLRTADLFPNGGVSSLAAEFPPNCGNSSRTAVLLAGFSRLHGLAGRSWQQHRRRAQWKFLRQRAFLRLRRRGWQTRLASGAVAWLNGWGNGGLDGGLASGAWRRETRFPRWVANPAYDA